MNNMPQGGHSGEGRLSRRLRERDGEKSRSALLDRLASSGLQPSAMRWLSLDETDELVARLQGGHASGIGGLLCFTPGDRPAARRSFRVGEIQDESASPRVRATAPDEEVIVLFHDYLRTGAALTSLGYLCNHVMSLAQVDGNGLVAVRKDDQGFMVVDYDDQSSIVDIHLWGTLLSRVTLDADN